MVAQPLSGTVDCENGRACLIASVEGLAEVHWDTPNVVGVWSVRACLSHLAVWDAWVLEAFDRWRNGGPVGELPSERDINEAAPTRWRRRPSAELVRTLIEVREELAERLQALTDEEREQPNIPVGEQMISVNDFVDALIEHDLEHTAQIRAWRKITGV